MIYKAKQVNITIYNKRIGSRKIVFHESVNTQHFGSHLFEFLSNIGSK